MSFVSYEFFYLSAHSCPVLYFFLTDCKIAYCCWRVHFYGWWDWRFLILLLVSSMDYLWGFVLDKEQYPNLSHNDARPR